MHRFKTHIAIFLIIFCSLNYLPGQSTEKQFSINELQEDFNVLRNKYEKHLANLYLYTPKPQLDKLFDSLYSHIQPMTESEFYSYITPISSVIKDGHSYIFPGEESTGHHNLNSKFFPFKIFWIDNKMLISMNLSEDKTIQDGTEILSINGVSVKEVMAYLLTRQVRDGHNDNYARWIFNNYFREYYSYHFGHPDTYTLITKDTDGSEYKIVVPALFKSTISKNKADRYLQPDNINFTSFSIDSLTKTGIFTIKIWEHNRKLKKEIDHVFSQLKKNNLNNLILDLRDNQGGISQPAIHLLSYLLDQPFQYFTAVNSVSGHSDSGQVLKKRNGKMLGIHQPHENPYKGNLYVLINGGSFSNSASFCSRIEYYKRGVFVGEETGGNKTVFTGVFGIKGKTVLPNTKIICRKANYQMIVTDIKENKGTGVRPTYWVVPTVDDLIKNKDVVMEFTLDLIKR